MIEQDLVEGLLALGTAEDLERLAGRRHPEPRGELATAGVIRDLRWLLGEELDTERLLDLVGGATGESQPTQGHVDLRHELGFECAERDRIAADQRERQVQIGIVQVLELGLGIIAQPRGEARADGLLGERDLGPRRMASRGDSRDGRADTLDGDPVGQRLGELVP